MSGGSRNELLTSKGVFDVLTTSPSKISFGQNLRAGKICQLRMQMALLKWSDHVAGSLSHVTAYQPSSLTSGAHNFARTYKRSLLVPSTSPLTHGEQAATVCSLVPQRLQFSSTSWFLKCLPLSAMKVSSGVKLWKISSKDLLVVIALLWVLNL